MTNPKQFRQQPLNFQRADEMVTLSKISFIVYLNFISPEFSTYLEFFIDIEVVKSFQLRLDEFETC